MARGHERFGGRPLTLVVTTEDLPPWQNTARRFAWLRDEKFLPLGAWAELAGVKDPALQELMAAPPVVGV